MTKEQIGAVIVILGVLAAAIQQFYELKTEVEVLRAKFEFVNGAGWRVPAKE